jgi:hypothetical protein
VDVAAAAHELGECAHRKSVLRPFVAVRHYQLTRSTLAGMPTRANSSNQSRCSRRN